MKATLYIRTMPRDVTCGGCQQPTRNATQVKVAGRVKIEGFRCDACIAPLPYTVKRI